MFVVLTGGKASGGARILRLSDARPRAGLASRTCATSMPSGPRFRRSPPSSLPSVCCRGKAGRVAFRALAPCARPAFRPDSALSPSCPCVRACFRDRCVRGRPALHRASRFRRVSHALCQRVAPALGFALSPQFPMRNVNIMACETALPSRLLFPKWQWYTYRIQGRRNTSRPSPSGWLGRGGAEATKRL